MPCTYTETPDEIRQNERKRLAHRKTELNKVTKLLCFVMTTLYDGESRPAQVAMALAKNTELQNWWSEHQKRDTIREKEEAREVVKKKALAKLSLEEKRILGLTK